MTTSLGRRLLGGMLALLLVSGVAGAQTATAPSVVAHYYRGNAYRDGQGVPQDDAQAVTWWRKAAAQGYAPAMWALGNAYRIGRGVPKDAVSAYMWFNLGVATSGNHFKTITAEARDAVEKTMTPTQIEAAQKLAREWLAAFEKRGGK